MVRIYDSIGAIYSGHIPRGTEHMLYKYCNKCHKLLAVDNFSKNKRIDDGYEPYCKECTNKTARELYNKKFPQADKYKVLSLHFKGMKPSEIKRATNYRLGAIREILHNA